MRQRLFVINVDGAGEHMHSPVLLPPIFASVPAYTELLANDLLQRLNRILFDIAARRVVAERAIMVLNFVGDQSITPRQADSFPQGRITRIVRWMHSFVDRIVKYDAEWIRNMGQEAQPGNPNPMRF